MDNSFYEDWNLDLAQELSACCLQQLNLEIRRQHSIQLISACFGMDDHGLAKSGLLESIDPPVPDVKWDYVATRLKAFMPDLPEETIIAVCGVVAMLWSEQAEPDLAFAKRLVRNIAQNCRRHADGQYSGSAMLTEEDWLRCGEIASGDDFVDRLAFSGPFPSIMAIGMAKPERAYSGHYQVEPDSVLNVIAFLLPETWQDFLGRYRK